ncbi:MAG: amidohydrolase family protein [Flavobacteriales bacterium]|nr:amidohydrolase family protein [Flavobacteriales bacterium]
MKIILIVLFTLCNFYLSLFSQRPAPAPPQQKGILITNAFIHTGKGDAFIGHVGFQNGKIEFLGTANTKPPKYDTLIDAAGQHLYPGFILLNTTLGLREVDAVRATRDYAETGEIKPEVRTVIAFNTDSKIIPTVRNNGILIAQPTPRGGIIPGQSGVIHLDAWNWEDAVIRMEDGLHVNWPSRIRKYYPWDEQNESSNYFQKERQLKLQELRKIFEDARVYHVKQPVVFNQKLAAMNGLFTGEKKLFLHADFENDIIEGVMFFKELGVKEIVLVGGYEAYKILSFMKNHQLPVILKRTHSLPGYEDDPVDLPFKMPFILDTAGLLVSIDYSGDMEAMGSRNLPFTAGTCVTYGLPYEKAVQLITLNAAKILGIDQRVGSIEPGKDATFFLSNGDALDMSTNKLTHAFIQGRSINLDSHQEALYRMYMSKFGLKE